MFCIDVDGGIFGRRDFRQQNNHSLRLATWQVNPYPKLRLLLKIDRVMIFPLDLEATDLAAKAKVVAPKENLGSYGHRSYHGADQHYTSLKALVDAPGLKRFPCRKKTVDPRRLYPFSKSLAQYSHKITELD